ncbi:two-component system LytT family response regulator [Chryseobacterium defluvii]|uniref:Two-component system LytT family response regulator n=1 Tax=Chryseobacterium defluvii TaxID=160396 RepID=A0A840KFJ8_9FLAO|nr:LytTR family DNA-binding domain-containing protein [Chryseobacterium defluvii]MBB4807385.1 two-component system LytT family response regulator [Chryseobacterium defluvii]
MSIKAFIIDDERKAISILKSKLERIAPDILITGEFQHPKDALKSIEALTPDLIFLDITMPEMNGFDFLKQIENPVFEIIFVTAYGDYAIEAIKHCAIGYIVKPIINDDLKLALENAKKNIEQKTALLKNRQLIENLNFNQGKNRKIAIPSSKGLDFIEIQNIIRLEGLQGYTILHLKNNEQLVSSYSIGYFYRMLENLNFFLIHKSHLINLDFLNRYDRSGIVELHGNHSVPVARNKREAFLDLIGKL